jgi:protein ImuB
MAQQRYVVIWFPFLQAEWYMRKQKIASTQPLLLFTYERNKKIIIAINNAAKQQGIYTSMLLADAQAVCNNLQAEEAPQNNFENTLTKIAEWCIRYSPTIALALPDSIVIDATGCTHLWSGEQNYINDIQQRLQKIGYTTHIAIASTIGAAWALSHYSTMQIAESGSEKQAIESLQPQALRLPPEVTERLHALGLHSISNCLAIPARQLQRRLGECFVQRLQQALGYINEYIQPITSVAPYTERLALYDAIKTINAIEIAVQKLLQAICQRLQQEQKGLRSLRLQAFSIDKHTQQLTIGTNKASYNQQYIFELLRLQLGSLQPGLGFELFVLDVLQHEPYMAEQESIWVGKKTIQHKNVAVLLDKIENKIGVKKISRYAFAAQHWPERAIKKITADEENDIEPISHAVRPLQLLQPPEPITVTAPVPDYPPMLFKHKGILHKIVKADGPERIEQEWWLQQGLHRDYYYVEDETGNRYWLFRLGHYNAEQPATWYLHGYCV